MISRYTDCSIIINLSVKKYVEVTFACCSPVHLISVATLVLATALHLFHYRHNKPPSYPFTSLVEALSFFLSFGHGSERGNLGRESSSPPDVTDSAYARPRNFPALLLKTLQGVLAFTVYFLHELIAMNTAKVVTARSFEVSSRTLPRVLVWNANPSENELTIWGQLAMPLVKTLDRQEQSWLYGFQKGWMGWRQNEKKRRVNQGSKVMDSRTMELF